MRFEHVEDHGGCSYAVNGEDLSAGARASAQDLAAFSLQDAAAKIGAMGLGRSVDMRISPRCQRAGPVFFFVFGLDPATLRLGQTKPPADLAMLEK